PQNSTNERWRSNDGCGVSESMALLNVATRHWLPGQRRQDSCPAADAFVESFQIEFFVGRMDPVVVQRKADHQAVHAEHGLEIADDGDRAAGADRHRLLAPFLLNRSARF